MAYIPNKDHHVLVAVGVWFGIFLLAALSVWMSARYDIGDLPQRDGQICTQEAKRCPDGSYVSRTGPHCEFTPCPMSGKEQSCLGVITSARNKDTGECKAFPSSCLPPGYIEDRICEEEFNKEVDISTWQTYRNEERGFEVKYPNNFEILKGPYGAVSFHKKEGTALSEDAFDVSVSDRNQSSNYYGGKNPTIQSLDAYADSLAKNSVKTRKVIISENEVLEVVFGDGEGIVQIATEPDIFMAKRRYAFIYNDFFYTVEYFSNDSEFINIFDQMLSTFKFIK